MIYTTASYIWLLRILRQVGLTEHFFLGMIGRLSSYIIVFVSGIKNLYLPTRIWCWIWEVIAVFSVAIQGFDGNPFGQVTGMISCMFFPAQGFFNCVVYGVLGRKIWKKQAERVSSNINSEQDARASWDN